MRLWTALFVLCGFAICGCSSSPTAPSSAQTASSSGAPTSPINSPATPPAVIYTKTTVSFTSDEQDYVGQGQSRTFTLQDWLFSASINNNGGYLAVTIRAANNPGNVWSVIVIAPDGPRIEPGTYYTSHRSFIFGGDGRGCGESLVRLVIHSFDYVPENGALKNFRASFEQRCQGKPAALRGEIAILADPWR